MVNFSCLKTRNNAWNSSQEATDYYHTQFGRTNNFIRTKQNYRPKKAWPLHHDRQHHHHDHIEQKQHKKRDKQNTQQKIKSTKFVRKQLANGSMETSHVYLRPRPRNKSFGDKMAATGRNAPREYRNERGERALLQ